MSESLSRLLIDSSVAPGCEQTCTVLNASPASGWVCRATVLLLLCNLYVYTFQADTLNTSLNTFIWKLEWSDGSLLVLCNYLRSQNHGWIMHSPGSESLMHCRVARVRLNNVSSPFFPFLSNFACLCVSYQRLLQTIGVLEAQRTQAILDLETMARHQREALTDPIGFVEQLQKRVKMMSLIWEYTLNMGVVMCTTNVMIDNFIILYKYFIIVFIILLFPTHRPSGRHL